MGITLSRIQAPFLLAFSALVVHLLPFWLYGANPLGYDTGFYRRYLIQPWNSFPNPTVPGLGSDALVPRLILDTLRALQLSPEYALYGSYICFFIALPVLMYYWLRPHTGNRAALIAGLLLALSPVGYTAYWYMLYKNAFALCLMLLAFMAYERRAFWPLIALDVLLAFSHKTSAIIYITTLCVLLLTDRSRYREVCIHAGITGLLLLLALHGDSIAPQSLGASAVAVFLEWNEYIVLSLGLFIAAAYAATHWQVMTAPKTLLAFALASFAFPVFHLPFYERIFVFSDVALIAFAAYGFDLLISKIDLDTDHSAPYGYFVIICIIVGLHLGSLQTQVTQLAPLETDAKLRQIETSGALVPPEALLLTTNAEAPWYEGWTTAHIAAPGMLRDTHDFPAWVKFWESTSTTEQISFLNTFPKPLYISTLGDISALINTPPSCLSKVAPHLLRNDCE